MSRDASSPPLLSRLQNPLVKQFLALLDKKERRRQSACLVVGEKAIHEARQAGWQAQHFFFRDDVLSPNSFAENVPWHIATVPILKALAETSSAPPVVGVFHIPENCQEQGIESLTPPFYEADCLLVLDGIQDPGNLGTLLRSAVAFGVKQVLLIAPSADAWSTKVIRSSVGLQFRLQIQTIVGATTKDVLTKLQTLGWQVYLADASSDDTSSLFLQDLTIEKINQPLAFVLGQEGQGLRLDATDKQAFQTLSIAMQAEAESLNVAITGSILMHHLFCLNEATRHA